MSLLDRKLAERALGAIPVSIATSLAIESACGIHPEITVTKAPVLNNRLLMVNIRTLIRNIYGALETEIKKQLTTRQIITALMEEMSIIESCINKYSDGICSVVFYACSHGALKRLYPYAIHRQITTDIQIHYAHLEKMSIKELLDIPNTHDIRTFDVGIEGKYPDTLMLTHLPVDLMSRYSFSQLLLLESHSGKIKNHLEWNSKLTKGVDLLKIPFCKFTLQVFGDNGNLFSPMPQAIKEEVRRMAEEDHWTVTTTKDKIVYSINKIYHPKLKSELMLLV
jgi:hypothetical protein